MEVFPDLGRHDDSGCAVLVLLLLRNGRGHAGRDGHIFPLLERLDNYQSQENSGVQRVQTACRGVEGSRLGSDGIEDFLAVEFK